MSELAPRAHPTDVCARRRPETIADVARGFSDFDDLISGQGEVALVLDYDAKTRQIYVTAHRALEDTSATAIQEAYLLASDDPSVKPEIHTYLNSQSRVSVSLDSTRATDTPHATTSEPERGRATPDTRAPTDAIRGTRSRGRVQLPQRRLPFYSRATAWSACAAVVLLR